MCWAKCLGRENGGLPRVPYLWLGAYQQGVEFGRGDLLYKLAGYGSGNNFHAHYCISPAFTTQDKRTYEAIESVFIVAPFFERVRTVLLHPDVDYVCRVTGSTADPSRC